jgi:polyphosphate glucokinase
MKKAPTSVALGIDIGGTGIKAAPVHLKTGRLLAERFRVETPTGAGLIAVCGCVREAVNYFAWKGPIGCTVPAVVIGGVLRTAANISPEWLNRDGRAVISHTVKQPITLLNDADAAGIAEMKFGAGAKQEGLVLMVTLGTGIGTALFFNGTLVPNSELGHLIVRGKDAEERASNRVREERGLSWKKWSENVNEYLTYVEQLLWPDLIIIGGGVSKKAEKFIPKLKVRARVVPAELLNDAGIVGAALAATQS